MSDIDDSGDDTRIAAAAVGTTPPPSTGAVLTHLEDGVLTLTLNRPHKLNSITDELLHELRSEFIAASSDSNVRCIVLTGAGRGFCAGQDLTATGDGPLDVGYHLRTAYVPLLEAMRNVGKPVIAAVNGVAAGAGLSLALACDLRVATASATFVQAFVRIGLVPDAGGSQALTRLIGLGRAMEMSLLGDALDASTALAWGLVNAVFDDESFVTDASAYAKRLAAGPRSTGMIRQLLNDAVDATHDAQLGNEEAAQIEASHTNDFAEGVTAFLEKRRAQFSGS